MKISLKRSLLIMSILGMISSVIIILSLTSEYFGWDFYSEPVFSTNSHPSQSVTDNRSVASNKSIILKKQSNSGLPIRLNIPKIHVDAALEYVGITSRGEMDVPKGKSNAGWFHLGPRPGENGSAVIDGHYGVWKNGKATVFNNLYKLQKGDKISIEDEKGTTIVFIVRGSRIYNQNDNTSNIFNSNDGKSHLNLITCQGVWNKVSRNYSNRLVVFADKERE